MSNEKNSIRKNTVNEPTISNLMVLILPERTNKRIYFAHILAPCPGLYKFVLPEIRE